MQSLHDRNLMDSLVRRLLHLDIMTRAGRLAVKFLSCRFSIVLEDTRLSSREAGTLSSPENIPAHIRNSLLPKKLSDSEISDMPSGGSYVHSLEQGRKRE